jgi:hypothetical protein
MTNPGDQHKDGSTNMSDEERKRTASLPDGSTSDGSSAESSDSESGDAASGGPAQ